MTDDRGFEGHIIELERLYTLKVEGAIDMETILKSECIHALEANVADKKIFWH